MANTSLYVTYVASSLDKPELVSYCSQRMVFTLNYHKKTTTFTENRVFWLCFVYDRLVSVRFGFPLMINELDIDVSLLNEPTISSQETLIDSCHFNWQVKLANIITQTLRKIYTRNSFSFIHNCYTVLKELKYWLDGLPDDLKIDMDNFSTTQPRSTINLHINYNYTIIITTRPVFLYVFNKVADSEQKAEELFPKKLLNTITTLLESSVQAAQIQSFILTKLYFEGNEYFLDVIISMPPHHFPLQSGPITFLWL
ncbi:AVN_HP_G0141070.mRNA.1.CDS.1 [Saccharomyces cerevisiae]|nr:AVN_HP_G0141070.mRNA.1.CDS.1 [Saccharomyces cerevisiae]CAI6465053.1 AVN_HP_G0141070.mRNA.1.CDS.1 [Saccharomyces cerevisiae]